MLVKHKFLRLRIAYILGMRKGACQTKHWSEKEAKICTENINSIGDFLNL
jgi:hypothetical protein